MGSKWRNTKLVLGLNLCVSKPRASEESVDEKGSSTSTETLSSRCSKLSKSLSKSSKTCSICLTKMKQGAGRAIFTAECSHAFHFHCIASNVKHGNQVCPVCRAKWKDIPMEGRTLNPPARRASINNVGLPQYNYNMTLANQLPPFRRDLSRRHVVPLSQAPEPSVYDDDENLDQGPSHENCSSHMNAVENDTSWTLNIKTFSEVSAVSQSKSYDNFAVLIHLKAASTRLKSHGHQSDIPQHYQGSRASVDLVTVLDISGSMTGTKLALLKRAMGFVIQNLGSNDRLSVIAFSSTARRLFPLSRMSEPGRQKALLAVNSLVANGGTNIYEGLKKGAKIMEERKEKNPVSSIILLSDGQDTYSVIRPGVNKPPQNYQLLLPESTRSGSTISCQVPIHSFGFGADHDASALHSISETSGGTFSFIENEASIQDAFAQCIGGLLSVVVQHLQVRIEPVHPSIRLGSIKAGRYPTRVLADEKMGFIDVGDLYADEERDFLVSTNVPVETSSNHTSLLKVRCTYNDPLTKEAATIESDEIRVQRPERTVQEAVSIEVDRQQNRLQAAESMAQARTAAEQGNFAAAVSVLENCRKALSETPSGKSNDQLCVALIIELKEMQERMRSRRSYEASGRAYILSGLSSHSWQRATTRGDSIGSSNVAHTYQTPSMVEMLTRSQTIFLGSPSAQNLIQPLHKSQSNPR